MSSWVKLAYESSGSPEEREPTVKLDYFEPHALSVISLALSAKDALPAIDPGFTPAEVDDAAALLLALSLLRRASKGTATPVSSDPSGEAIALARKWSTLADTIADLKAYEDKLVRKGSLVLRKNAPMRREWEDDTDDGTFVDAAGDVRRRLDFIAGHPELFKNSVVTTELLNEGETLHTEANTFYRGREGRSIPKEQLTLHRDLALTLLIPRLEELRPLLIEHYQDNDQALSKLQGDFWKKLNSLSKKRRPRVSAEPA